MANQENTLYLNKHVLLCAENDAENLDSQEIDYLKKNFCGKIIQNIKDVNELNDNNIIVYVCGNIGNLFEQIDQTGKTFLVIKELSYNYDENMIDMINLGEVPINVYNVGVLFRKLFNDKDYFELLTKEHQFQKLTESNKPGTSYRNGIYITKVEENGDEVNFNLLRCSTNLDGPTDNFRETDNEIVNKVNRVSECFFQQKADLNHVLAQVYNNSKVDGKEKKATIKTHSDKTKDMPLNGLMSFCTFYKFDENVKDVKQHQNDRYDYYYKDISVLTKLRFRLKNSVTNANLVKNFDVILYPNSVFICPLSTNRLYTHEIVPSYLSIDKLPTRLGYVIRCSKTKAVFKNNQTFIVDDHKGLVKLEEATEEKVKELKDMYYKENISEEIMNYGQVDFSLNQGDYLRPNV